MVETVVGQLQNFTSEGTGLCLTCGMMVRVMCWEVKPPVGKWGVDQTLGFQTSTIALEAKSPPLTTVLCVHVLICC